MSTKIILVRYGDWRGEHLTEWGTHQMQELSNKLLIEITGDPAIVVSAKVARAVESAEIIAKSLKLPRPKLYKQLYAAEEDGKLPDLRGAKSLLKALGKESQIIIAVVSREYIQGLPSYILGTDQDTHLERGECIVIDTVFRTIKVG